MEHRQSMECPVHGLGDTALTARHARGKKMRRRLQVLLQVLLQYVRSLAACGRGSGPGGSSRRKLRQSAD
eukprot:829133-Rhodomonas_salina.1